MKRSQIFVIALMVMFTATSCGVKVSASNSEISVAAIRANFYRPAEGDTFSRWKAYEYNADGNKTKITNYDRENRIMSWEEYEYDANGNQIKLTFYNGPGSYLGEGEYNEAEALSGWRAYQYDSNGNQVKETYYSADGSIDMRIEYLYDAKGCMTKETLYDADNGIMSWYEYEYGADGKKTKRTFYDYKGALYMSEGYFYYDDLDQEQTIETYYDENGEVSERILKGYSYQYDGDGRIVKEIFAYEGETDSWWEYIYLTEVKHER